MPSCFCTMMFFCEEANFLNQTVIQNTSLIYVKEKQFCLINWSFRLVGPWRSISCSKVEKMSGFAISWTSTKMYFHKVKDPLERFCYCLWAFWAILSFCSLERFVFFMCMFTPFLLFSSVRFLYFSQTFWHFQLFFLFYKVHFIWKGFSIEIKQRRVDIFQDTYFESSQIHQLALI